MQRTYRDAGAYEENVDRADSENGEDEISSDYTITVSLDEDEFEYEIRCKEWLNQVQAQLFIIQYIEISELYLQYSIKLDIKRGHVGLKFVKF